MSEQANSCSRQGVMSGAVPPPHAIGDNVDIGADILKAKICADSAAR